LIKGFKTISKDSSGSIVYYSRFNIIYFSEIGYLVQGGGFLHLSGKSGLHADFPLNSTNQASFQSMSLSLCFIKKSA